jgi:prevent-host-death family protein
LTIAHDLVILQGQFIAQELMTQVNIADAKAQLSALVDRAAAGEEIVLAKAGKAVARLMPLAAPGPRQPGVARHWRIDDAALLQPADPEDLDWADGLRSADPLAQKRQ